MTHRLTIMIGFLKINFPRLLNTASSLLRGIQQFDEVFRLTKYFITFNEWMNANKDDKLY